MKYKWIITKYYETSRTSSSKGEFENYSECLQDMLKHKTVNVAFPSAFESKILGVKMEVVTDLVEVK